MELKEYRSFIDKEMIVILGQMDSASKIFDHVYLVSKWIFVTEIMLIMTITSCKLTMNEKSLCNLFCIY